MKTTPKLLLLLFLISTTATAQVAVKEFYTKDNKRTNELNAFYYTVGEKLLMKRGGKGSNKWFDTVFVDTVKTFYVSTKTLRSKTFYQDGMPDGVVSFYYENGRLKEEGAYKGYNKIGTTKYWTDQGNLQKELLFLDFSTREEGKENFKIIQYWDGTTQLVKDGEGYCKCVLKEDGVLEEGKVVGGYRDLVWKINAGDTLTAVETYNKGILKKGESIYKGEIISYDEVLKQAEFPGSMQGMMRFLAKTIRYPAESKRAGVDGKVYLKFSVDVRGVISDITILKGVAKDLNDEAIRVVKLMPNWTPSKSRGIPVKSDFVLPIYFKLDI